MLRNHAIPGAERFDDTGTRLTRLLTVDGRDLAVTIGVDPEHIELEVDDADTALLPVLAARVRAWFDLDADLGAVSAAFDPDPVLGPLVRHRPNLRVTAFPDGAESAVMHVLGQQVSMGAARTFGGRLVAAFGVPGPAGLVRFPTPEVLADLPLEELRSAVGITGARARTVQALARELAAGLSLDPIGSDGGRLAADTLTATRRSLLAIPGIGPWTADSIAVRVLGDRDGFPSGDLVLRRAMQVATPREADVVAERWRPWRALALFHLWMDAIAPTGAAAPAAELAPAPASAAPAP
jgi:3-methyladenine DNA glycosylase/8-oxoguanine DNA glycosylase